MEKASLKQIIDKRLKKFIDQDANSSPYLIMTIFGDSVIPHGGEIWLGSLVQLLEPLGINERLVRTSIFRLTKETWLESNKIGRKSFYSASHVEEINRNEQCLYYQQDKWDGYWRLLIGVSMEKACYKRDEFRKELLKNGFFSISSNVFAHPTFPSLEIKRLLKLYDQNDSYVVLNAQDTDNTKLNYLEVENILSRNIRKELKKEYDKFIKEYQPIYEKFDEINKLSTQDCFLIKTLMINDYRRLLWHDRIRSSLLMDDNWAGRQARCMAASIYCNVDKKGQEYFRSIGEYSKGALPPIDKKFQKRFKHLI